MERLQVILELIAGQYKREASEAAASTDKITNSAKTAETTTANATRKMTDSMKGAAMAAKTFIVGAAVAGVVALGKESVEAASNLEESMNAVNVTFGEAAEGIHALGEESSQSFGLSQRAFNEFAVRFSAFAENIAGATGQSVVDVVEDMTTRIADFASVMNLDMEEAARVVQSALAGETEAFRRFGGDVSAAAVQQKALELGLGETSAELTEQEKILARYELIMEQTDETADDFKNTQDSLANSTKTLGAEWEDFQAMLGKTVTPALADLAGKGTDLLTAFSGDVNLGWSQRLSAALQTVLGDSRESIDEYIRMKEAENDAADAAIGLSGAHQKGRGAMNEYRQSATEATAAVESVTFSMQTGESILDNYNDLAREGGAAWDTNTGSIQDNIEALQAHQDQIRAQIDPLFNLRKATEEQAGAEEAVLLAIQEFGEGHPEHLKALEDLAIANLDLKDAQADARVETNLTKDAFIDQQVAAGMARDQAQQLADVLFGLSGLHLDPIRLDIEIRELRRAAGSQAGGYQEYHTGGVVQGDFIGQEVLIKALAGEVVTPIGAAPPMSQTSGGVVIENLYATGTPASIAHDVGEQVSLELRMA